MKTDIGKADTDKPLIKSPNLFPVVGIGASAGGLDAFKKLLKAIPENSGMAYVLVQHLDPNHESLLPELLQKVTKVPVLEITDDIKVKPDHIYILPSNKMLVANDGVLELTPRITKKNELNLPIDLFFASLAEIHQSHAIGVVLSGTGSDGTKGLKAIKDHGGITFAQDEASAGYDAMPNSAVQANVVDFILSPDQIPQKLLEIIHAFAKSDADLQNLPQQEEEVFKKILTLLRIRKGTDFTYYKQTTIRRRILRRMTINKNEELGAYLHYLREYVTEQDVLYQDLLIPVTSFFRDPKVFDYLCESVFPHILKNKSIAAPIRVWVAGCSTGQEAYSIAICLKEFLADNGGAKAETIQIFASDLSAPAIVKARTGIYTKTELEGLTPQRLRLFFTKINDSYQVNKPIREMCVFAAHNFLKDPPFGKVDFISCRNVLIYMDSYLQKKALTTFHYALNPNGFLLLGKSETISSVPDLFASANKHDKLFSRKDMPGKFMLTTSRRSEQTLQDIDASPTKENLRTDFQKMADDIMLSKYTPAGVVVNEAMDIVHFRGKTGNYLEQLPGKPTHNLLQMAKSGLAFELRSILHKAKKEKITIIKENIPLEVNGSQRSINIEAFALPDTIEPHYFVIFHDNNLINSQSSIVKKNSRTERSRTTKKEDKDLLIQQLEKEIAQNREDMRAITEDQEAVNEELQSANEELLSGSEELQSLNEELESSKEELQSTNEELTVVNQEMRGLNEQISEARKYAEAIIANISTPLLVLDKNLRIKTANRAFYKKFQVDEHETEGRLIYHIGNRQWDIEALRLLLEQILPEHSKISAYEVRHTFQSIGERIMLLDVHEIKEEDDSEKLILLSINDITEQSIARKKVEESQHRYHNMIYTSPSLIAIFKGEDMIIEIANDAIIESWGKGKDIIGKSVFEVIPEMVEEGFDKMLLSVYKTGEPVRAYEIPITFVRNGKPELMHYTFIYQAQRDADGEIDGVAVIANEVTPQVLAKKQLEESEQRFRNLADESPIFVFIVEPNAEATISYWNKTWLDYTGQTFEEALGRAWEGIIHPDDVPGVMNTYVLAFEKQQSYFLPGIRVKRHDGVYRWHMVKSNPHYLPNGEFNGYIGVGVDIHDKQQAEDALKESESHFRSMADLMPAKISNASVDGNVTYFSKHWLDFTGLDFEELKELGYHKIMHPDELEEFHKRLQKAAETGTDLEMEMRFLNKDGDYKWHLNIASPVKDETGQFKMWISVTTDISEQIKTRDNNLEDYEIHSKDLEEKVTLRTLELSDANQLLLQKNDELGKMNKELESFSYISSHDLQEPLRKIQVFAKRILEKEEAALSDNGKDYFHRMQSAANRMQTLIDDLLAYSRTNTAERKFEYLHLAKIIQEIKEELKDEIQEKQAILEVGNLYKIHIIPFQFRQLIQNLVSNALKFSDAERLPHIRIQSKMGKGSEFANSRLLPKSTYCHISISDNGIGFEPQYSDQIFRIFQRLHGKEKYEGTGIGLAIVKKIVENHNGVITATGQLNQGATFDIYLPQD
ncbi:chemotaxis protein CheB [Runella sp.]|uniref:chemotaxis protein CheB n=1 Tax=Runella sp. TaxID=1960881 RepID=UPI002610477C|nr:chemotaxis protein CheB [Runella sp.]